MISASSRPQQAGDCEPRQAVRQNYEVTSRVDEIDGKDPLGTSNVYGAIEILEPKQASPFSFYFPNF
jgi:hypothetical protein